jgi:hypothetical protein
MSREHLGLHPPTRTDIPRLQALGAAAGILASIGVLWIAIRRGWLLDLLRMCCKGGKGGKPSSAKHPYVQQQVLETPSVATVEMVGGVAMKAHPHQASCYSPPPLPHPAMQAGFLSAPASPPSPFIIQAYRPTTQHLLEDYGGQQGTYLRSSAQQDGSRSSMQRGPATLLDHTHSPLGSVAFLAPAHLESEIALPGSLPTSPGTAGTGLPMLQRTLSGCPATANHLSVGGAMRGAQDLQPTVSVWAPPKAVPISALPFPQASSAGSRAAGSQPVWPGSEALQQPYGQQQPSWYGSSAGQPQPALWRTPSSPVTNTAAYYTEVDPEQAAQQTQHNNQQSNQQGAVMHNNPLAWDVEARSEANVWRYRPEGKQDPE